MKSRISNIAFSIGGMRQGFTNVDVNVADGVACVKAAGPLSLVAGSDSPLDRETTLSADQAERLCEAVLGVGVLSWEPSYECWTVLDGEQWQLSIQFEDGRRFESGGRNEYPEAFDDLLAVFQEFGLVNGE